LALRFDHRRGGFRVPQGVCVLEAVIDWKSDVDPTPGQIEI
jgi:hypothetical protein